MRTAPINTAYCICVLMGSLTAPCVQPRAQAQELPENLRTENLIAWCVVPFDAKKRGPAERAEMLSELGIKNLAYDWRQEHIPTWGEELRCLQEKSIRLSAFWCSSSLDPAQHPDNIKILDFLRENDLQTELWFMLPSHQLEAIEDPEERLSKAASAVRQLAVAAAEIGCKVGLYNHGGWAGKPKTLLAILNELKEHKNVGLVYNFHHAHEDMDEFPAILEELKPFLLCLNLNGTTVGGPKILPIGEGQLDRNILKWIRAVEYEGPIGILDHRSELDAKISLRQNLSGLDEVWNTIAK